MEEVSARLGWAWEPREVTPGRRPVMEIAGLRSSVSDSSSVRFGGRVWSAAWQASA
ncbi:hypothetical protein ACWD26_42855 [Streptomyces sp. NPDC002787]